MNIFGIDVGSVVKAYVIKEVFFKEKKPVDYTKHFDSDDYMMNMHIKEAIEYRNKGIFAKAWDLLNEIILNIFIAAYYIIKWGLIIGLVIVAVAYSLKTMGIY